MVDEPATALQAELDHLQLLAARYEKLPDVAAVIDRCCQLLNAGDRVVHFASRWRPPGRLGYLIDDLERTLTTPSFAEAGPDPASWDGHEWRRRAMQLGVAWSLLLQRATELAHAAHLAKPRDLDSIPPQIASDLVAALEDLANNNARNRARKVVTS